MLELALIALAVIGYVTTHISSDNRIKAHNELVNKVNNK